MDHRQIDISQLEPEQVWPLVAELSKELALGAGGRLSPIFLVTMVVMGLVIWLRKRPGSGFWSWMFPKRVYVNNSFYVDLKLYVLNRILAAFGLLSVVGLAPFIANSIQSTLSGQQELTSTWHPIWVGLALFVSSDFSAYWVHRVYHEVNRLWPFHALHHSAEELNPLTVLRKHPIYSLTSSLAHGVLMGLVQGLLLTLFIGKLDVTTIMGTNLFYYLFNVAGSNLRHTHVWFSWGKTLEHLFISPAQHQIHHSLAARHFNKNYGEVLAIWDWMFGTLYIPEKEEKLSFGIANATGERIQQPHYNLRSAIIEPFQSAFRRKTR